MKFSSTGGSGDTVSLATALFRSIAPDGGLYMPCLDNPIAADLLRTLPGSPLHPTALTVANALFEDELELAELSEMVHSALDSPIPLVPVGERTFVLELFHGPTLAFKDVGARFMARLLVAYHRDDHQPLPYSLPPWATPEAR